MLYLNIRQAVHNFLDIHEYRLPLSAADALDAKIADTLAQWSDEAGELYADTVSRISGKPKEFVGQIIDIVEDTIAADSGTAVIVGSDYDALANAIKQAVITYGAFNWQNIASVIPMPCDCREMRELNNAMMAVTVACDRGIPLENAVKLVAHYQAGVSDFGSPLITQEAAYAICELLEEREDAPADGVGELLALDDKEFLGIIVSRALSGMENVLENNSQRKEIGDAKI